MPGPAWQELKARRRRSAAFLLGSDKEAADAPDGAAAAAAKQSGNEPQADAAKPVLVVQAESVPDRDPGCFQQLLESIGYGTVNIAASIRLTVSRDQRVDLDDMLTAGSREPGQPYRPVYGNARHQCSHRRSDPGRSTRE